MTAIDTTDLSEIHVPLTTAFDTEVDGEIVSNAEIERYEREGYLTGRPLLDTAQVELLRSELDRLMQPSAAADPRFYEYHHNESSDPSKPLFHALGAWRVSPAFHDILFFRPLVGAAERLLGGPVRFWHDQLFVKPAHDGGIVAWHQDYSYWTRTKPVSHLTCWIGLDDSTKENGCLHYVAGSHKWPLLPRGELANNMEAILDLLTPDQRAAFQPVAIELKAGEASFHHPMTLHGSYENRSDRPRRAAVINFIRDGVLSDTDEPLLAGVPPVPRGTPIGGRFFPLLSR